MRGRGPRTPQTRREERAGGEHKDREAAGDTHGGRDAELTGRDRARALRRVRAILLDVEAIVDDIDGA